MPQEHRPLELSKSEKWNLIAANLKSWYLSWPSARNTTNLFLSDLGIQLTPERATVSTPDPSDEQIDRILDYYRSQTLVKEVLIWYLHDSPPERLNAKFLARGASLSGNPDWMWCDLFRSSTRSDASCMVEGVTIEIQCVDFPETSPSKIAQYTLSARISPDHYSRIAGTVTLHLTPESVEGMVTSGGLFDMFVSPDFRNRGIGTMLARAACDLARELGCQGLHLNASKMGRKVYERVGFEMVGSGCIWRIDRKLCVRFYEERPPRGEIVRFLEAICLGDVDRLENLGEAMSIEEMQQPTRNGMTPLELAVSCRQTASAEWLVKKGVEGDVLSFWDLGWKSKAIELVETPGGIVHTREGRSGRTFRDVAIQREDQELATLLASVPPPRVAENKNNDIDIGAVDWESHFHGAANTDADGRESVETCRYGHAIN